MGIADSISRFTAYYTRHGFGPTIRRAGLAAKRAVFASRMVVFYYDLDKQNAAPINLPASLRVERLRNYAELSPQDLDEIINVWNPKVAHRNVRDRFEKGAALWLIKSEDKLAGYSWTIRGRTIAPYYFLLGQDDIQLFDFYSFPKFRGRAILWFLISQILRSLKDEGAARIFGDVAEWNQPSLAFYKMTPFRRLGLVRSFRVLGHTFSCWVENETDQEARKRVKRTAPVPAIGRPHDQ